MVGIGRASCYRVGGLLSCALFFQSVCCFGQAASQPIRFAHDIRPILSEHCLHCHGPDASSREADLRLDVAAAYLDEDESASIVVPGNPHESELFLRVSSDDPDTRMPPAESGDELTPSEIAAIRQWIEDGAHWEQHWSFIKPVRPQVPTGRNDTWPRNAIDRFILQRLEQKGLAPSPEADRPTLIRRVSLDLTGLPPAPEEVDQFLADTSPDAYERLVERLLASPRYGEQMAATWLDAARYADTYGYQDDGETTMWRWRDWVIEAFNAAMRFDQFTIEQLAGDLLPNPTFDQRVATAFNRNHRHNSEGGAIPEEFRTEYVIDRVDTTSTVWLGLTLGCARCHDHKYDPIPQKEFYELFAFFNNIREDGRARKEGNTPPLMPAPTREQLVMQRRFETELKAALGRQQESEPQLQTALARWEHAVNIDALPPFNDVTDELDVHARLDGSLDDLANPEDPGKFINGADSYVRGAIGQAAQLDGNKIIKFCEVGSCSSDDRVTLMAWIRPSQADGAILAKIELPDDPQAEGYSVLLRDGRVRVQLVAQWLDDAIRIETKSRVPLHQWTHIAVTYDGSHTAQGTRVYFNGAEQPTEVELDSLFQGFGNDGRFTLGTVGDRNQQFRGAIDDVRVYEQILTPRELAILAVKESVAELLKIPADNRTQNQQLKLRTYYIEHFADEPYRENDMQIDRLRRQLEKHRLSYPSLMVMQELDDPRRTHLLNRGQYDAPGEVVTTSIPDVFSDLPEGAPRNRLGLAQWLLHSDNPLTGRVAVNRIWQMSFDRGLVRTAEDFGAQGELPSHPRLLDWLATELIRNGWDIRAIRRLIVTSATYRQQSQASTELLAVDPDNQWLARGPRFRLAAEVIRDSALLASGLLVEQIGGPSVKPYQPAGLWEELGDDSYEQDRGENLYRRSLYTFWKRTVTHPLMTTFDAPSREICTVREQRTNTPLQALALMNEAGMVEAARVLAQRVLSEGHPSSTKRLARAFRLVTSRHPQPQELSVLQQSLDQHLEHFGQFPQEAERLAAVGEYPTKETLDAVEVASYTTIANMLLNLDEVVTQH
ncbi:MAG: DUF1553 domain-containing protein [Bythopirellula sp.]